MGGYTLPVPDPNDQNNPYGSFAANMYGQAFGPYGANSPADTSQMGYAPHGNEVDVKPGEPMPNIFSANRDTINTTGNVIGGEAGTALANYGQQQGEYQGAENQALNQLQATPGYTDAQAAAITGNPYAPVNQLNANVGGEQSTLSSGVNQENAALDQYGQDASAQLQQTEGWQGGAANQYKTGVSGAAEGLGTGLQEAQQGFDPLNTAVYNPNLKVSDQDVQNMVTAAGTTVGNQFGAAEDTLERQAAAAGNSSPAALAAERQQLVTQEAATAGDTMTQANIAAKQYQLGALQQQTGMQATAATTEEAAAQAAAGQAGQANIGAQEAIGANTQNVASTVSNQALNEANTYGQFDVGQQNTQTGQQLGQQDTQTGQQYTAGTTAENEASGRAATEANQAITGQTNYRQGVAQQQQTAQQGAESEQQAQLGAYGTQTSGINNNTSAQSNYAIGKPSLGDELGKSLGGVITNLFEDGGVAYEPQYAKIGERGPEMVVPLASLGGSAGVNAIQQEGVRGAGRYRSPKREDEDEMFGVAA